MWRIMVRLGSAGGQGGGEEHDCYFPNILPFIQYSPCHHHPAPTSMGGSVEQDKESGLGPSSV